MEYQTVQGGFLSILPPLIAIALALITKEVVFSLVLGIFSGVCIYGFLTGLGFIGIINLTVEAIIKNMQANASMIIFLSLLGALVALITRAGGAKAYSLWAGRKLKSRRSALLTTGLLGLIIFIDDYFTCLTVGTVMKPVTDRFRISREKLAYIIDSTAAPVCVIAPISSWSASAAGYFPAETGISGLQAFILAIPYNLYALLTIFMIFWIALRQKGDYGPMAAAEARALESGDIKDTAESHQDDIARLSVSERGLVIDLVGPVLILAVVCISAMLYYGGYWDGGGKTAIEAFGDTDANLALSLGGFVTLIAAFLFYVPRKLISFKEYFVGLSQGVKAMVPAMLILTLAWTIAAVCKGMLDTGEYLASLVRESNIPIGLLPAILFAAACGISFSTGTAWGTFGILIPISITVCYKVAPHLSIPALAAVMGGAVFGDHCSPISDTSILASIGSGCNLIDHITTQIPYAVTVASVCFVGHVIAGLSREALGYGAAAIVTLAFSAMTLSVTLLVLPKMLARKSRGR